MYLVPSGTSDPICSTIPAKSSPIIWFVDGLRAIFIPARIWPVRGLKLDHHIGADAHSVGFWAAETTFTKICPGPGVGTAVSDFSVTVPSPTVTMAFICVGRTIIWADYWFFADVGSDVFWFEGN
jgi:hypothetical protein